MVCFHNSIPVDQHIDMARSVNSPDPCLKLKQINQFHNNKKSPGSPNRMSIPVCEISTTAIIDVVILIAVIGSCGVLLFPYANILACKTTELTKEVMDVVIEEVVDSPMVFGCLGLSIFFAAMALVMVMVCTDRRCGKAGCRGLRKAAEFDIQLETEDSTKRQDIVAKSASKKGMFELPREHHRELEAELKKMAPPNGKAVLIFRARCGCSIGRMEAPGTKKTRKIRK